jgi:uncharacterized protein
VINKAKYKRIFLIFFGFLFLALGGLGAILPILPTTPFVLLAAACFSSSSPRLTKKLEASRFFGSYLRHWRTNEGVPIKTKRRAIIWLWVSLVVSAFIVRVPIVYAILAIVGSGVTIHLILIKTKESSDEILQTAGTNPRDA